MGHKATLLPNGNVLVDGGYKFSDGNTTRTSEVFDPTTGTWAPTRDDGMGRMGHTATLLSDGKVLVTGGTMASYSTYPMVFAGIYDSTTGTWMGTGSMGTARWYHTATLLRNGMVLVAGGRDNTTEIYNPAMETWNPTSSMGARHDGHTATLLNDGTVMVAFGIQGGDVVTEIYMP